MSRLVAISFLLCFFCLPAKAQRIQVEAQPQVANMMDEFIRQNKARNTIEGWRIEIMATTSRQQMESAMRAFQYQYPNLPIDWVHANPYFKVRVGAFATKLEATHMLHVLKKDYPGAYRVLDNTMRPEELIY